VQNGNAKVSKFALNTVNGYTKAVIFGGKSVVGYVRAMNNLINQAPNNESPSLLGVDPFD